MYVCVSKRALKVQRSPLMHNSSHLRVSQSKIQQILLSLYIKSGFSRETEPTDIFFKEIYYEGLAHKLTEAEKSHHLPSASWKNRRASGVIQPTGLRIREADGTNHGSRVEDKMTLKQ